MLKNIHFVFLASDSAFIWICFLLENAAMFSVLKWICASNSTPSSLLLCNQRVQILPSPHLAGTHGPPRKSPRQTPRPRTWEVGWTHQGATPTQSRRCCIPPEPYRQPSKALGAHWSHSRGAPVSPICGACKWIGPCDPPEQATSPKVCPLQAHTDTHWCFSITLAPCCHSQATTYCPCSGASSYHW